MRGDRVGTTGPSARSRVLKPVSPCPGSRRVARGDVERLADPGLELGEAFAAELDAHGCPVAERDVQPDEAAQGDDPQQPARPGAAAVPLVGQVQVVRTDVDRRVSTISVVASEVDLRDSATGMAGRVGQAQHVHVAEEPGDERGRRVLVQLLGRAHLLDPPAVEHHDLVGDLEGLLLVVGDEQARDVDLVVEPAEPGAQLLADLGVEGAERLVEEQHLGPGGQGPRQAPPAGAGRRRAATDIARHIRRAAPGPAARRPGRGSPPSAACGPSGRTRCCRGRSCGGTARSAGRRSRRPAAGSGRPWRPRRSIRPCRPRPSPGRR